MKKLFAYILLIAILVSLCACGKKEETATTAPVAGSATEATLDPSSPEAMYGHIDQTQPVDGVHKIWNAEGVKFMLQNPNNNYEILCNIDMADATVAPMGEFAGKIEGANFIIKNFTVQGGDESDFGLFTVNKGDILNMKFENVTLIPGKNAKNVGGFAGRNEGLLSRCTITGTMDVESTAADANVGSLVGSNIGTVQNMELTIDVNVTAEGAANVGGIAGLIEGGEVNYIDTIGKLDVTGQGKSVGLFAGKANGTEMISCAFVGASNTIDGKLFTNFTGEPDDDERKVAVNGLWRDNEKEPLTPGQEKLRDRVVQEMYEICSIEWHPNDLVHTCYCTLSSCHGTYSSNYTYIGIPYNHKGGSLDRFKYCINEDGTVKDWVYDMPTFDGYDAYIGNDCSTAALQALWTVSNSVDFLRVRYELPQFYDIGHMYAVGGYNWDFAFNDNSEYTDKFWKYNTEQEMFEAYACVRRGDLFANMVEAGGHTRMAACDAVVVRDQDGLINGTYSYLLIHEQGSGWTDDISMTTSTCKVNGKDTFGKLAGKFYIPVTCEELITGEMEPVECAISKDAPGKAGLTTGYIKANYYLDAVTLKITDSQGNVVFNHKMYTTAARRAETSDNDQIMRNYRDDYDMAYFATPLQKLQLEIGETYSYSITARLGTYDEIVVKEDSFVNG